MQVLDDEGDVESKQMMAPMHQHMHAMAAAAARQAMEEGEVRDHELLQCVMCNTICHVRPNC